MKRLIIFFFLTIIASNLLAQQWEVRESQRKKLEEFKKVKLIEALDLSEEEVVKFFVLYNDHQKKVRANQKERKQIIDQFEKLIRDEAKFNVKKFEELEKRLNELELELFKNRQEFHSSLKNVLTPYKIAKFYVFEREFIREINQLLMMRRGKELPE